MTANTQTHTSFASRTNSDADFEEHMISSGNYQWHVKHGGHSNSVYLLLHGTGASSHSWLPLMNKLIQRHTVVAIDLPGHAHTITQGRADLSLLGMARAIRQLLKDYSLDKNTEPLTLVGHSAGAAIAAQLILDEPALYSRMVSINGALVPLGGIPGLFFPPVAKLSASVPMLSELFRHRLSDPAAVNKLLLNTGSTITSESARHYHELCKDKAHINGALQMMASWRLDKLYPRLGNITVPVQLIAGSADAMIPARDAHRLNTVFKNSRLNVLPNLGHLAHEEQPGLVADIILKGEL